ncbi:MAG TPA: NAD-dependent epimerase/dehydratase family protein [Solirubrobacterales bacterium]|jgi:nucleoside-diphosphate-sugar epimerase|nr:NAD-dependent epimerase/dehydratase family protein [Solirubrobacterales bacterium]
MRVVVTGASGNVGTSVLEALGREDAVEEIVGIARRVPAVEMPKVRWVGADVTEDDLVPIFAGADAVVHLAWAIQPSRDEATTERINVEGSRRVFDAVAKAGVGAVVYASSVGAYSPGPKQRQVDESWPVDGIRTSFYSRHKAAVETILDAFEQREPEVRVVRLRPGLIFKSEAASEIRRLFAGPFLPGFLVQKRLIPLVPNVPRLRFQAVHSRDVGEAYRQAVVREVHGAFNIAAEPEIGVEELRDLFGARSFPLPAGALRAAADLTWKLRLQPSPPGWIDLALGVPMMDTTRARTELGWDPAVTSLEALDDLLRGMRNAEGAPTPPLEPTAGGPMRAREVATGVGQRQGT